MQLGNTVHFNSFKWVKEELRQLLLDVQRQLEEFVNAPEDTHKLDEIIVALRQVRGTLSLVEIYGAALLSEEMEMVARALKSDEIPNRENAFEVLLSASIKLPDYLDSLATGSKDVPLVLLPLLNDLRACRNASLLSENVLFFPDISAYSGVYEEAAEEAEKSGEDPQKLARKARPHYQLGLLGWFRGKKTESALKRMQKVVSRLRAASGDGRCRRLWRVSLAIIESLQHEGVDSSVALKSLMGKVDRQIKRLADEGEAQFADTLPDELTKNLLYYVARSEPVVDSVKSIQSEFRLDKYLPSDADLASAERRLGGPNQELLDRVSAAIQEDINLAKDAMEVYLQGENDDFEQLETLLPLYSKIADTLGMLGLGRARENVLLERSNIQTAIDDRSPPGEDTMMSAASMLLGIEDELESYVSHRADAMGEGEESREEEGESRYAHAENQRVVGSLINEALKNIALVKDAFLTYIETPDDPGPLENVPELLKELAGAMFIDPLDNVQPIIRELGGYFEDTLIKEQRQPGTREQDTFADVITNIECFLEAVAENRVEAELYVTAAQEALAGLQARAAEPAEGAEVGGEIQSDLRTLADDLKSDVESVDDESESLEELVIEDVDLGPESRSEAEAPAEAEPQQPARPATRTRAGAEKDYSDLQVIGDDADEEIIEIFIEEALEELERISTQFPAWRQNPADREAITTIRRSFHTLKGSGRLIGATLIGEFAWAVENMLNRVIDGTVTESPAVLDVVEEATTVLPQLIEQIRGNRQPVDSVFELMEQADRIAAGEKPGPVGGGAAAPASPAGAGTESTAFEDGDVSPGLDAGAGDADAEEEPSAPKPTAQAGGGDPDDEYSGFWQAAGDDEEPSDADDGDVFELGDFVDDDDIILEDAPTVGDGGAAEKSHEPEESGKPEASGESAESEDLSAAAQAGPAGRTPAARQTDTPDKDDDEDETLIPDSASSGTGSDDDDTDGFDFGFGEDEDFGFGVDTALLDIFSEEAETHLAEIERVSEQARMGSMTSKDVESLTRALHTLHGSARTAKFLNIAEKAKLLEHHANNMAELGKVWPSEDLDLLQKTADYIRNCIAHLREHTAELRDYSNLEDQLKECAARSDSEVESVQQEKADTTGYVEPVELDTELVDIFLEEAPDILGAIEHNLQEWKSNDFRREYVNEIMRQLHTLKGSARMASLSDIGDLSHMLESLFIAVSSDKLPTSDAVVEMLTDAVDRLMGMMDVLAQGRFPTVSQEYLQSLEDVRLWKIEPEDTITVRVEEVEKRLQEDKEAQNAAESSGKSPAIQPAAEAPQQVEAQEAAPAPEKQEAAPVPERQDPVEQMPAAAPQQEQIRVRSDKLDSLVNYAGEVNIYHSRLGQHVTDLNFNLGELAQTVTRLQRQLRDMEIQTEAQIASRMEREAENPYEEFDPLEMDRYSHMQQLSRSLSESASDLDSIRGILSDLVQNSEVVLQQQSRVSTELQEELLQTRMVKFQGLASRLRRIVRQTALQLDKKVELNIAGADHEIDRSVQERMLAPLEHMLRNAVYHGIEKPDERSAAGKPDTGTIQLNIDRDGSYVVLNVSDDGKGIDVSRIRRKAMDMGLLSADEERSDHEVMQYILQEGFSTADDVSQIAGRGVGLDVVDTEIKQLGGSLTISSEPGRGTMFNVRLPLTLAINQALMVRLGEDVYAIPLTSIEGVALLTRDEVEENLTGRRKDYEYAGQSYDMFYLGSLLGTGLPASLSAEGQYPLLLMRSGRRRLGIHMDAMLGRREIVVKPVGPQITAVPGISGATILADGRVALILDVAGLVSSDSTEITVKPERTTLPFNKPDDELVVMVVDDSITIRKVTARILGRHNLKVVTAKDGLDAVQQLQDVTPDLFLLDIEMPQMDGFELATHVRSESRLQGIPIIMITSRTGEKHRDRAKQIGVDRYLGKPFQENELMNEINALLERPSMSA